MLVVGCSNPSRISLPNPHRLRKRSIRRNVPYLEPNPFLSGQVYGHAKFARAERVRVGQLNSLTMNRGAIARDNFGEGQRERPFEIGTKLGLARFGGINGFATLPPGDSEFRNQNFSRGRKELSASQHV